MPTIIAIVLTAILLVVATLMTRPLFEKGKSFHEMRMIDPPPPPPAKIRPPRPREGNSNSPPPPNPPGEHEKGYRG